MRSRCATCTRCGALPRAPGHILHILDPHGKIKEATEQLAARRALADEQFNERLREARWFSAEEFAAGLLNAAPTRWHSALDDKSTSKPGHPLWVWHRLSGGDDFSQAREKLVAEVEARAKQTDERWAASDLFADFSDESFRSWFCTGHAFAEGPTAERQWDWSSSAPAPCRRASHIAG